MHFLSNKPLAAMNRLLSSWKSCGLVQRVGFNRLSCAEAGIHPPPNPIAPRRFFESKGISKDWHLLAPRIAAINRLLSS